VIRRRFLRDLDAIARGEDPKALLRDPALNHFICLPVADCAPLTDDLTRAKMLHDPLSRRGLERYIFQTGQPPEVRETFLAAMGFNGAEFAPSDDFFDPLAPVRARGSVKAVMITATKRLAA
jgi:5,5'-dehydrodivanillate O-demethylase